MTIGVRPDAVEPVGDSLRQNALDPGSHGVPPVRHARIVMLIVPVGPESGFPRTCRSASAHEPNGIVLQVHGWGMGVAEAPSE